MIRFLSLGSGSKGNAVFVYDETALFLVDMGLGKERLLHGLERMGKAIGDIDGVFFTHNHSDHTAGAPFLPVSLKRYSLWGTVPFEHEVLSSYRPLAIKGWNITPIRTSHDAPWSTGYVFEKGGERLSYLTDSGIIPAKSLLYMKNSDIFFIECNHDVELLKESGRPESLIARIRSEKGHLSNEQCRDYLSRLVGPSTREICLAHLSEECNDPYLALAVVKEGLADKGIDMSKIEVKVASQWEEVEG